MRKTVFVIQRGVNLLISVNNLSFQSQVRSLQVYTIYGFGYHTKL